MKQKKKDELIEEIVFLKRKLDELEAVTEQEIESRVEERFEHVTKELKSQAKILSCILCEFDIESCLDVIVNELTELLGCEFSGLFLKENEYIVLRAWKGLSPKTRSHLVSFQLSNTPEWIAKPALLMARLDEKGSIPDFLKSDGIQSLASVPLIVSLSEKEKKEWLGTVFVASRHYDGFSKQALLSLKNIADQSSLAVKHSITYLHARQRLERLEILHEIDRAIIQRLSLEEILSVVLDHVPPELGADAVAISLIDGIRERPKVFLMRLPNGTVVEEEAFVIAESLLHWFTERKDTVIIYELANDPRLQMHWDKIQGHQLSSYLGVPLVVHETTIGILHILTKEPKVFKKEDVAFFRTMAGQVAIAIENVRLLEATRAQSEELKKKVKELEEMASSLKKSEASLSKAQEIAKLGGWEWDIETGQLQWSKEVFRIFGIKENEFEGTHEAFLKIVHPEDRERVEEAVNRALYSNGGYDIEHRIILPDRTERIVHERAEVIFDSMKNPLKMIGTVQDITKQKELERIVAEQDKMASLGHMAAGIVHEIKNPLSGLNVCLAAIKENLREDRDLDEVFSLLDGATGAVGKISSIVDRIMDFARSDGQEMVPLDINAPLEEAIRISATNFRKFGISLRSDLSENLPRVYADFQLMEQVILNLLSNALEILKESESEKRVVVSSSSEGDFVTITVEDSGPGVPVSLRDRIFDPFFTTRLSGTGVGLSLCKKIILEHGGMIKVDTSQMGGALFKILLPIKRTG